MQISPIKIKILKNRLGTYLIGPKWRFWKKKYLDISQKKFGSAYAQSPQNCSNIEILAKIEGKEAKFFSKIYEGHIRIWFWSKKFKIISCLCTFKIQKHHRKQLRKGCDNCCRFLFYETISTTVHWLVYRVRFPPVYLPRLSRRRSMYYAQDHT